MWQLPELRVGLPLGFRPGFLLAPASPLRSWGAPAPPSVGFGPCRLFALGFFSSCSPLFLSYVRGGSLGLWLGLGVLQVMQTNCSLGNYILCELMLLVDMIQILVFSMFSKK